MDIKNLEIKKNIEEAKRLRGVEYDIDIARKSGGLITQSAISKFMSAPETSNPTVEKLRGIAQGLKIEPWMLLVQNFPFEFMGAKPLDQITGEGYRLLTVFESLPDDKRKTILDFVLFQINEVAPAAAKQIREARATYQTTALTYQPQTEKLE